MEKSAFTVNLQECLEKEKYMDEFKSGRFVTSDGVRLHYLDAGSGPTLVFVPGWTMPTWIW